MSKPIAGRGLVTLAMLCLVGMVFAAEKEPRAAAKAATHTVKKAPLKIEVALEGVFEGARAAEVSVKPKAWRQFKVVKAVQPGATVKKGDPLVWFERKDLDQKIRDIEAGLDLDNLAFKKAVEELRFLESTTPRQLAWDERAWRIAQEDYEKYKKQDLAFQERFLPLDEKGIALSHKAMKEEFRQLKEMYTADELVEDTEEMLLERWAHRMKRADINWEKSRLGHAWRVEKTIPRAIEAREKAHRDAELAFKRARVFLPLKLKEQLFQMEKKKYNRAKAAKNLDELKADRNLMIVRAPADGVVYCGRWVRGRWIGADQVVGQLREEGQISPDQAFLTIVQPGPMVVHTTAAEKDVADLRVGVTGTATAAAFPEHKLTATLKSLAEFPETPGKFPVTVAIAGDPGRVKPGMTCTIRLAVYDKKDALSVPAKAVFSEETDARERFVYVKAADGKAKKRAVTVGRKKGDVSEIVKGLTEGEVILLEKPGK